MNIQGTQTGRYHSRVPHYNQEAARWPRYASFDLSKSMRIWNKAIHRCRIKVEQRKTRERRSVMLALKGHAKREKMLERNAVESLVRRKNDVYRKWRKKFKYPVLDNTCAEILMVFGELPRWEEYVKARRGGQFRTSDMIEKEHRVWKDKVRVWCLERDITTYPNQSAQFLKFYFAWYRYQWEKRHGPITRQYARQMQ